MVLCAGEQWLAGSVPGHWDGRMVAFFPGNLFVTGSNGYGQLGTSDPITVTMVTVGSDIWGNGQVTVVTAGQDHTAVVAGVPHNGMPGS